MSSFVHLTRLLVCDTLSSLPHCCQLTVCSLHTAYVPVLHYARLANKPYSMKELDNREVALTVSCYDEDETIANAQERRFHTEFQSCLDTQYGEGVIDTTAMWTRTLETHTLPPPGGRRNICRMLSISSMFVCCGEFTHVLQ